MQYGSGTASHEFGARPSAQGSAQMQLPTKPTRWRFGLRVSIVWAAALSCERSER